MNKQIGIVGLGKMGKNVALRLLEKGWKVVGYNRSVEKTEELVKDGLVPAHALLDFKEKLIGPRVILLLVPAGETVDEVLFGETGLASLLDKDDIVLDVGNSFYKDSVARGKKMAALGIRFADVGISGGPAGARNGACLMVGGSSELFEYLKQLFMDMAKTDAVQHFEGVGAGHFVKMVHNGIEYGFMQALGEGFEVMKKSPYQLDLSKVANIYNNGSVIESRLVGWLENAYRQCTTELDGISGEVAHSGEGQWTVETAKELGVAVPVIEDSYQFRVKSKGNPSYTGKVVSALRGQFGGHSVSDNKL